MASRASDSDELQDADDFVLRIGAWVRGDKDLHVAMEDGLERHGEPERRGERPLGRGYGPVAGGDDETPFTWK